MNVGRRSEVRETTHENGARTLLWSRSINGTHYTFNIVYMPNGEVRWFVSQYNRYPGGMEWACAWTRIHAITFPKPQILLVANNRADYQGAFVTGLSRTEILDLIGAVVTAGCDARDATKHSTGATREWFVKTEKSMLRLQRKLENFYTYA